MNIPPVLVLMALALLSDRSAAQQHLYRCGNTFSQTPCSSDAASRPVRADALAGGGGGKQGGALCAAEAPRRLALADAQAATAEAVGERKSELIQYAGQSMITHRYEVAVNTKNAFGAYEGPVLYVCHVSEDQQRVLKFEPRGGGAR